MSFQIKYETPTVEDYIRIRLAAGLSRKSVEAAEIGLSNTLWAVRCEGNLAFVDGYLRTSTDGQQDHYGKFTDYFKFKYDKIVEYKHMQLRNMSPTQNKSVNFAPTAPGSLNAACAEDCGLPKRSMPLKVSSCP